MANEKQENLEEFLGRALSGVVEYARKMKTPRGQVHEEKFKFSPQFARGQMSSTTGGGPVSGEAQAAEVVKPPEPAAVKPPAPPKASAPVEAPKPTKDDFSELLGALVANMLAGEEAAPTRQQAPETDMFAQNPQLQGLVDQARRTNVPFLPTPEDQGITRVMKAIAHGLTSTEQSRQAYQGAVEQNFALNLHLNQLKEQQKNAKTELQFREMEALRHQQEAQQKQKALQSLLLLTAVPGALQTQQGETFGRIAGGVAGIGNVFPAQADPFKTADTEEINRLVAGGMSNFEAAQTVRREKESVSAAGREPPSWREEHQEEEAMLAKLKPGMMELPTVKRDAIFKWWISEGRKNAEARQLDVEYLDDSIQNIYGMDFVTWSKEQAKKAKD